MEYDYSFFMKDKVKAGRRFGKTWMTGVYLAYQVGRFHIIGKILFPFMTKKNQTMLNDTVQKYVVEQVRRRK